MKGMKRVLLAGAGIAMVVSAGSASAQDKLRVGWTSYPADLSVIADAIAGAQATADAMGIELKLALGAGAVAQSNAVDNLLASGIDVLAIDPEDSNAIGPSIQKANELGIPVIMWIGDNLGAGETATLISSDEEAGGYTIGKWATEQIGGSGPIALLQGTKAHQAGLLRENGFNRALAESPDVELAAYGEGNWMRDRANAAASDMLTRVDGLKFIVALSDDMAAGAYSATVAAGVDVPVSGYNGSCEVLNSVWEGKIRATLYQGWRDIGSRVIETAAAIHAGETVPEKIIMPTYVIDHALMEKVQAEGVTDTFSQGLVTDAERAIAGCQ